MNMYDYILKNSREVHITESGMAVTFAEPEWDEVCFGIEDLPGVLPGKGSMKNEYIGRDERSREIMLRAVFDKAYVGCLKDTRIRFDKKEFLDTDISNVRRPFFMVRGRSISYEEVKYILKNELYIYKDSPVYDMESEKDDYYLNSGCFGHLLIDSGGSSGGWLWDTGEIGGSGWDIKYPEFRECMPRWLQIAMKYPFTDMAVGYTLYAEQPCYFCPLKECYECRGYVEVSKDRNDPQEEILYWEDRLDENERIVKSGDKTAFPCRRNNLAECEKHFKTGQDFWSSGKKLLGTDYAGMVYVPELLDDVVLTVQIHEGSLNILTGDEAKTVFREYDKKYGFEKTWRYAAYNFGFFHELLHEALVTEETLRDCFTEEGMDTDKCMECLINKYDLDPEKMRRQEQGGTKL